MKSLDKVQQQLQICYLPDGKSVLEKDLILSRFQVTQFRITRVGYKISYVELIACHQASNNSGAKFTHYHTLPYHGQIAKLTAKMSL